MVYTYVYFFMSLEFQRIVLKLGTIISRLAARSTMVSLIKSYLPQNPGHSSNTRIDQFYIELMILPWLSSVFTGEGKFYELCYYPYVGLRVANLLKPFYFYAICWCVGGSVWVFIYWFRLIWTSRKFNFITIFISYSIAFVVWFWEIL